MHAHQAACEPCQAWTPWGGRPRVWRCAGPGRGGQLVRQGAAPGCFCVLRRSVQEERLEVDHQRRRVGRRQSDFALQAVVECCAAGTKRVRGLLRWDSMAMMKCASVSRWATDLPKEETQKPAVHACGCAGDARPKGNAPTVSGGTRAAQDALPVRSRRARRKRNEMSVDCAGLLQELPTPLHGVKAGRRNIRS